MKANKFLPVFVACFFSITIFQNAKGQSNQSEAPRVFFKTERGPYWTRFQLDSFLRSRANNRYKIIKRVTGIEKKNDTTVYNVTLVMDPAPVDVNNKQLAGQQLPQFDLTDMDGKKISTESLKGKPVVINFWFTTCAPCIAEMPALNTLKEEFRDSDVVFIGVTFDKKTQVLQFLKRHSFDFTIVPGANTLCAHMTVLYPLTLFVDRQGLIKYADHYLPSAVDPVISPRTRNLDIQPFEKNIKEIMK